ncbi:MAG: hypothetical protein IT385_23160 [Deltaproteobacteria bacterium]|nr:hypothetical protein [Deltaproteobacteria bacterium]
MRASFWIMVAAGIALGACGDEPKKRPLGGVCDGDEDCVSGLCLSGMCLDPEADEDGDGVINRIEGGLGSNPLNPDTDYDGVGDADELTNFASRDTDGDGAADIVESQITDADEDCLPDELDPDNGTVASDLTPAASIFCSRNGVCRQSIGNVRVNCVDKTPVCVYDDVPGYEADEATCDGRDNDCDARTDEGHRDTDGDDVADCVDTDLDGDGEEQAEDNCPELANEDQADADGDGAGDVCDPPALATFGTLPSPTNDTTPTVAGTGEALSIVHVYADAACATEIGSGAASAGGAFSFDITLSGAGGYSLYIQTENPAGLESACASAGAIVVDLTAPGGASALTARATAWDDGGATFTIGGVGEAGGTVMVYTNGTCGGTAAAQGPVSQDGLFTVSGDFANGTGAIGVTITDAAGNVSSCVTGPVLFGEVTVAIVRSDKPMGKFPVQFHFPDGAAMDLVWTDSETGLATVTVFAGCALTVPVESREGYSRWVTVWGVEPGQQMTIPVPEYSLVGEDWSRPVQYEWPQAPEGATYGWIETPCGGRYAYIGEGAQWVDYYGPCLGETTFDAVMYAYGDSGLLGFGVVRDNVVPPNGNSPTKVVFPAWTTDLTPDIVRVRFDDVDQPSPVWAELSERLGRVGLMGAWRSGFANGPSTTIELERVPIAGATWDLHAEITHLGANGDGARGRSIIGASHDEVIDVAALPPRVLAADLTWEVDRYTGFFFIAEAGLAASVDAGLVDFYFYNGEVGSLDWRFVMAPRDEAEMLFPTFGEGFPAMDFLAPGSYANGGNVTWFDWEDRSGFGDVVEQCEGGFPNCFESLREFSFTSCCGGGERD